MNRRNFFKASLVAGALITTNQSLAIQKAPKKKVLRFAHLTDIHVDSMYGSADGMAAAFQHVCNLRNKPDFIITGGDHIGDALTRGKPSVKGQWKIFKEVLSSECNIPIYPVIGNHDLWGWGLKMGSKNPDYGKKWALDELELKSRFYSFSKNNRKFIFLDSCQHNVTHSYEARLDDEQFEWLEGELENTKSDENVCVITHVPIMSISTMFDGSNETSGKWVIPAQWMHIDARRIKELFKEYPKVKLAISGHIHLHDEVNYLGVKYLCNGAVCGGWWNGNYQEFPPAYVLIDLYNDGSIEYKFIPYQEVSSASVI